MCLLQFNFWCSVFLIKIRSHIRHAINISTFILTNELFVIILMAMLAIYIATNRTKHVKKRRWNIKTCTWHQCEFSYELKSQLREYELVLTHILWRHSRNHVTIIHQHLRRTENNSNNNAWSVWSTTGMIVCIQILSGVVIPRELPILSCVLGIR